MLVPYTYSRRGWSLKRRALNNGACTYSLNLWQRMRVQTHTHAWSKAIIASVAKPCLHVATANHMREQKPQSAQRRRHDHPKMNCEQSHAGASVPGSVRLPNVYSLEVAAPEIWRRRNMKKKPDIPLSQPQNLEQVMVQRYSFGEEQSANFMHLCSQMAFLDSKH